MNSRKKLLVLVAGTDPDSGKGGIANALPGYLRSLEAAGIPHIFNVTHTPDGASGKWKPWLKALSDMPAQAMRARKEGYEVVAHLHAGGGLPSLFRKGVLAARLRKQGVPVLIHLHGPEIADYLRSPAYKRLFERAIKNASGVALLTPWWKRLFEEAGIDKPLFVIPNPLDPKLEQRARLPIVVAKNRKPTQLLTMTRLEKGKGTRLAIKTLALLPDHFHLHIAGTGSLEAELRELSKTLGLDDRITFHGWITGDRKDGLLDNTDIFFLPTRLDSFGMGFLEAMAWGKPVVAIKWQAIQDVVPHLKAGILLPTASPEQLASAIIGLINHEQRAPLGSFGKNWVIENYSATSISHKLLSSYISLINYSY